VFDPAATKAGVGGLAPHELRHTCARLAIRSRASMKTVQRLLGHATATMTLDNYGHLYPDKLDQVAQRMGGECVYPVRTEESQKAS
jgi:integrase